MPRTLLMAIRMLVMGRGGTTQAIALESSTRKRNTVIMVNLITLLLQDTQVQYAHTFLHHKFISKKPRKKSARQNRQSQQKYEENG